MDQHQEAKKKKYVELEPSKEEKLVFEITNLLIAQKVSLKSALTILEDVKDGVMKSPLSNWY